MLVMGWFRRRLFGISPEETTFARRGFPPCAEARRPGLERIGRTFVEGYHAALEDARPLTLARRLDGVEASFRGFAYEGAAMGLTLLDLLTPWHRRRWSRFLAGPGAAHRYMVHVGAGWALARLGRRVEPTLARLDPLLGWLAVDGYGFHEGFFHWRRSLEAQVIPRRLSGYARRVFDQGLGRSLWFVGGTDVARIAAVVAAFPPERRADLWSGVGLAAAYAGGGDRTTLLALARAAGAAGPALSQGVAFAAKVRERAGNPVPHTELACEVLCGQTPAEAARVTDRTLENLPLQGPEPAYAAWRRRIQAHFSREVAIA